MHTSLLVDGIEVHIEGEGPRTILMLHGWPDTHHLWDAQVAHFKSRARCVRFTLPGFDHAQASRPTPVASMCALLDAVVEAVSPQAPVTLMLHDWGCVFGYAFATRHPERVERVVGVDVGDAQSAVFKQSLTAKAQWAIFSYQIWLAFAWALGPVSPALATGMTRRTARALRCPSPVQRMGWQMNYPYAMEWFGSLGGWRGVGDPPTHCPVLYLYGLRKPFMFHSQPWLTALAAREGCAVQAIDANHWVMLKAPQAFNDAVDQWLSPWLNAR